MNGSWAEPDVRDEVVDYMNYWTDRTEIVVKIMIKWLGISRSKFYNWKKRYGMENEHNGLIPRDFWCKCRSKSVAHGVAE